jgi:peroxiredoxin
VVAVSTDPPAQQTALARRLGGRVTFLSDAPGVLLDHLGVRHVDGVPFYDRLLFKAPRHDIAQPVALVLRQGGEIAWARRSRRIDERPPLSEILAAARA